MRLLAVFAALSALSLVQGKYDTLQKKAEVLAPPRLKAIRDFLDPGMLQEAAFHILDYYAPTDSENPLCRNHSSMYQDSFLQDQSWAVRMMDASTKLPNGMLDGNFQDLGSFDECMSIEGPYNMFTGQMCLVQTSGLLPPIVPNPGTSEESLTQALPLDLTLAVCVPSSCSPADVEVHWHDVMKDMNASAAVSPMDCTIKGDTQLGTHSWLALYVLGILTLLIVASTCFDYFVNHEPTKGQRILLSFSLHSNLRKLFHPERREDSLDVLDVLRFLASTWIVLGHRFELNLQVPRLSLLRSEKYATAWFMSPLLNFMLSVEIFFIASGCLLSYHFLQEREKGKKFKLVDFYYKRLVRITPAMLFMMMLEGCLLLYIADGPVWKRLAGTRVMACVNYWWSSILYISNYVNPFNICVMQTWYTAADMQLYLISPLLLFPLSRSRSKGLLLLVVCYAAITGASFLNAFIRKLPAGAIVTLDKKTELNYGLEYTKTHLRSVSWVNGLALGYVLHLSRNKQHWWIFSKDSSILLWVVSVSLCLVGVFSVNPFQSLEHQYSPLLDSLYIALHRNIFSIGMTGIILLCVFRDKGFIKDVIQWKGFRTLAILSYGVFLSHMFVETIQLARVRQPLDYTMYTLMFDFLLDLLLSNMMAVFIYLYVEAPFWEIGRWLYNPRKSAAPEKYLPETINVECEKTTL